MDESAFGQSLRDFFRIDAGWGRTKGIRFQESDSKIPVTTDHGTLPYLTIEIILLLVDTSFWDLMK